MRKAIYKLAREGMRAGAIQLEPRWPEGEVTVDQHRRLKISRSTDQLAEAGVSQELVARADHQVASLRKAQEFVGFLRSLNEWFLNVHVGTCEKCAPCGSEVRSRWCAYVHELRFGVRQDGIERWVGSRASASREFCGAARVDVVDP